MKNTAPISPKNIIEKQHPKKAKHPHSGSESPKETGLYDLLIYQLNDIYRAEKALAKAIPKLIKKAASLELTESLTTQLSVTKEQVSRLELIFSVLDEKAEGKKCSAMEGLIDELEDILEFTESGTVRDAGIICISQKIAHYGISTYGTLTAFARALYEEAATALLLESLDEKKEADLMLYVIAEAHINAQAADLNDEGPEEFGGVLFPESINKHFIE